MKKKLALSISFAVASAITPYANAVGLGEVKLQSALNQPLQAEIHIRNVGDFDESQLLVNLASREDFERAGVDREFFLTGIHFDVELLGNGDGVVRLSTNRPVKEPYLDLVVELRWPSGRVLRNYTMLLDLPLYSGEAASVPGPSEPPPSPAQPKQEAEPSPRVVPSYTGDSYHVVRGDTLWGIATRLRSGRASIQQTMMALHRLNPEAFIDGNINRLKADEILLIPDRSDVNQLSARDAISEVREQNRRWRQGEGTIERRSEPDEPEVEPDAGVLRISGADQADDSASGEGLGGTAGEATGALDGEELQAEDQRVALERENEELRSRLDEMEEQVDTAERLIAIQDDEMSALQDSVAEEPVDYNYQQEQEQEQEQAEPSAAKSPAVVTPPPEPTLLDKILGNVVALGAGLAALIGIALFMVFRRRGSSEEEQELPPIHAPAEIDTPVQETHVEEAFEPDTTDYEDELDTDDEIDDDEEVDEEQEQDADLRPETEDALAEAEIYLAYGRSDAAMELLSRALEEEPERSDLRLKLMEICVDDGEREAFLTHFEALDRDGDTEATSVARGMVTGSAAASWFEDYQAPDAISQSDQGDVGGVGELDLTPDFDDEFEDEEADPEEVELEAEPGSELDLDAELDAIPEVGTDLDFDAELDAALEESPDTDEVPEIGTELDFDAELDGALEESPDTDEVPEIGTELDLDAELDAALEESPDTDEVPEIGTELDLDTELDTALEESPDTDEVPEIGTELDLDAELDAALEASPASEQEPDIGETAPDDATIEEPVAEEQAELVDDADTDDDLGLLDETDEVATKLDLAKAYIDMGDVEGAREILDEVVADGNDEQREQAGELLGGLN